MSKETQIEEIHSLRLILGLLQDLLEIRMQATAKIRAFEAKLSKSLNKFAS